MNKIDLFKKFLFSFGLGVSFLMFFGLFIDIFYPIIGIEEPLSPFSLIISLNVMIVLLACVAYYRNRDDFNLKTRFYFDLNTNGLLPVSITFFPILFPLLSVIGTYYMNLTGSNAILISLLLLIPTYSCLIIYLNKKISQFTYPIVIIAISLSLSLMFGLRSNHVFGATDTYGELGAFTLTYNNFRWDPASIPDEVRERYPLSLYNSLSITILPTIYKNILNISNEYTFKIIYPLIISMVPLGLYILSKKYLDKELYAFLTSFLLMAQMPFMHTLPWICRQEVALSFFTLAMVTIFDDAITSLSRRALFIIFMFSVVVSHYSTAYIFFVLQASDIVTTLITKSKRITAGEVALFSAVIFFWDGQVYSIRLNSAMEFIRRVSENLAHPFFSEVHSPVIDYVYGRGLEIIPQRISVIITLLTFFIIGIGFIYLIFDLIRQRNTKFEPEYVSMTLVSGILLVLCFIIPTLSRYGVTRLYIQLLILLAPLFILGGRSLFRYFEPRITVTVLTIILIAQFFCGSYMTHQAFGFPYSGILNNRGFEHDLLYTYDAEVSAAKWLNEKGKKGVKVYTDVAGTRPLQLGYQNISPLDRMYPPWDILPKKNIVKGYIYLRSANIANGIVYHTYSRGDVTAIDVYKLSEKNRIYDAGVEIYYK